MLVHSRRRFSLDDLKAFAADKGIETIVRKQKVMPVWQGKQKGMRQILWERGWLDPTKNLKPRGHYSVNGPKLAEPLQDGTENDLQFSLRHLLSQCEDFKAELTALQYLAKCLGTTAICTPKYHAELAGEGIEYAWGLAKNWFKRLPLYLHKGDEEGQDRMKEFVDIEKVAKLCRSHRSAEDKDASFLDHLIKLQ